jgi:hypothetical protein
MFDDISDNNYDFHLYPLKNKKNLLSTFLFSSIISIILLVVSEEENKTMGTKGPKRETVYSISGG